MKFRFNMYPDDSYSYSTDIADIAEIMRVTELHFYMIKYPTYSQLKQRHKM